MADIVAKPISVLRQEANTIHEANTRGENTQFRVGGLFQDIVDWLAVNVSSVTLLTPLAEINGEQLSAPTNGQGLVYNNGHWQYGDFGGGGGGGTSTVDWNNITNKPNTFIPSTSYSLDSDATNLYLKITENQETNTISTIPWPSGGGGGGLPNNLVYYTLATYGEHFTNKQCINTKILELENLNSSGGHFLWVNPATSNLMFDEKPIVGSGIEWGENTAPANTLPNIVLNGNLYLQQDSNQYGGIFAANRVRISDYTLVGEENTYGYLGNRDIWVEDGELHFGNMQVTKTVDGVQMLNVEGEADDLHLEGNHLWLWNTVGEYKIGSGVELPASGGGGGGSTSSILGLAVNTDVDQETGDTTYEIYIDTNQGQLGSETASILIPGSGSSSTDLNAVHYNSSGNVVLPGSDSHSQPGDLTTGDILFLNSNIPVGSITSDGNMLTIENPRNGGVKIKGTSNNEYIQIGGTSGSTANTDMIVLANIDRRTTLKNSTESHTPGLYIVTEQYVNSQWTQDSAGTAKVFVNGQEIGSGGPSGGLTAATAGGQNVVATGTTTAAIPVADDTHYGVIKIDPAATLGTNQYPVKKLSSGVAYVEVSGGGGGWTPTGGTTSNPKVATDDIENKAITNTKIDDSTIQYGKLHDNVGDVYLNATSLDNLLTALDRINVSLIKQLDSVNHNFVFWAPPVHYTGQTFGTDAMYLYYSGNIICREGTVNNPIFYYNGSTLQVCVDGTRNKIWRFDTSSGPVQSSVICYDDDVSTGGGLTLAINGKIYSWSWNATPRKTVSNGCTLDVTKYL